MTIGFLADHPECRATLASWYLREWPRLFGKEDTPWDELDAASGRDRLPCTLIGFVDGRLAASAALLVEDVLPVPEFSPWLGSVVVSSELRGRGLGRGIVQAATAHAASIGIGRLHLWTPDHRAFYEKLGWEFIREGALHGRMVSILGISFR
jgi:GNAT superfamily N-acetyltransferase